MRQQLWKRAAVVAVAVMFLAPPTHADQQQGRARAHPVDGSGIQGQILFLDSGNPENGLVVSGTARGLDPAQAYVTLIYDSGAVPGGPAACLPTGGLTGAQMFVGFWGVDEDGNGTLFVQKAGDGYADLGDVGAVSIRRADMSLGACGRVHRQR